MVASLSVVLPWLRFSVHQSPDQSLVLSPTLSLRSARRTAETTRLLSPNPSLSHLKLEKETKAYKRTYHGPGPSPHPRIPAPRNSRLAALLPVGYVRQGGLDSHALDWRNIQLPLLSLTTTVTGDQPPWLVLQSHTTFPLPFTAAVLLAPFLRSNRTNIFSALPAPEHSMDPTSPVPLQAKLNPLPGMPASFARVMQHENDSRLTVLLG